MHKLYLASFVFLVSLTACGPIACSTVFETFDLTVRNEAGDVVQLDSIIVSNLETDEVYPACNAASDNFPCLDLSWSEDMPSYEIMNDGFNDSLRRSGTRVLVKGVKGDSSFSEEYVFSSGECHVELESGSLDITLE